MRVRPGEWAPTLLLQLQIFLIIAVLLITKPVGNAIYVSRFGPDALPYAYILVAIVAALISTGYSYAVRKVSILRVNLWSMCICALLLLVCVLLIPFRTMADVVAVSLYLWVALFGVLAASQFWSLASMVFDIRQSKRLFGPIGAGAIAGGIAGGYLASILAQTFGTRFLLTLAACMLLPVIGITVFIWRKYIVEHAGRRRTIIEQEEDKVEDRPHELILKSRHLLLLSGIIGLSVITAKLVDYQFSALASARYADPARLTAFFGFWFSTFNVIGLIIQLLLTHRVVQRLGVSGSLMFLPTGLGFGALLILLQPTLAAATFSRCVDGSLKQSLHRAGVEMLYLPVALQVKNRIKTYIDVLIDSAAGGLGGLLLILLIDYLGWSPAQISWLVLALTVAWFTCVLFVREEYLDAFRDKLAHLRPKIVKPRAVESRHREVVEGFYRVLTNPKSEDEAKLLYVLERTEVMNEPQFLAPTERLLYHANPNVRARALHNLSVFGKNDLYDLVIHMLNDPEVVVKKAALEYLINRHLDTAEEIIQQQLRHANPEIAGEALIDLLIETTGNEVLRKRWQLQEMFTERVKALEVLPSDQAYKWRLHLLIAAGRSGSNLGNRFIAKELRSIDEEVVKVAIIAAAETHAERWVLPLIDFLSMPRYRGHASAALVQYHTKLVRLLPRYLRDGVVDLEDLRRLPCVIEGIKSEQTVSLLFSMMEKYYPGDLELRMEVLRALNAMRRDFPRLPMPRGKIVRLLRKEAKRYRLVVSAFHNQRAIAHTAQIADTGRARSALIDTLRRRREGNLERLFRLLGLLYAPADIIPIYRGLRKASPQERTSALEFLETLLDNSLKRSIMPLVEREARQTVEVNPQTGISHDVLITQQRHYFERILKGSDHKIKAAVLFYLRFHPDEYLEDYLRTALFSPSPRVRKMAGAALDALTVA